MPDMTTDQLRQNLMSKDPEFRQLVNEHCECSSRLDQLLKQPYLSAEDLIQETELKKMKLRLKDQMERILARHLNARLGF
jgi:uncharacterized protein